jgi:hypothetical protein
MFTELNGLNNRTRNVRLFNHLTRKTDNFIVIFYLSASEIWPDKKGGLIREGLLHEHLI